MSTFSYSKIKESAGRDTFQMCLDVPCPINIACPLLHEAILHVASLLN